MIEMFEEDVSGAARWTPLLAGAPPHLAHLLPDMIRRLAERFPPHGANDEEFIVRAAVAGLNRLWARAYVRCRWPDEFDPLI